MILFWLLILIVWLVFVSLKAFKIFSLFHFFPGILTEIFHFEFTNTCSQVLENKKYTCILPSIISSLIKKNFFLELLWIECESHGLILFSVFFPICLSFGSTFWVKFLALFYNIPIGCAYFTFLNSKSTFPLSECFIFILHSCKLHTYFCMLIIKFSFHLSFEPLSFMLESFLKFQISLYIKEITHTSHTHTSFWKYERLGILNVHLKQILDKILIKFILDLHKWVYKRPKTKWRGTLESKTQPSMPLSEES